jgi:hypothetical protein
MKYRVKGTITYEMVVHVDEEVEAPNEATAAEWVTDSAAPSPDGPNDTCNWSDDELAIEPADEDPAPEDVKMRRLGAPMLPLFGGAA